MSTVFVQHNVRELFVSIWCTSFCDKIIFEDTCLTENCIGFRCDCRFL